MAKKNRLSVTNKLVTIIFCLWSPFYSLAQAPPDWNWAKSTGGTDYDEGTSVTTDASGNVYMTGWFKSTTLSFGTTTLTSAGSYDIFLVKYAPDGSVLWAKSAGGTSYDYSYSVTTDPSGNVYMTGGFGSPTMTFGTTSLTNAGDWDIFLVKYAPDGSELWAKSAGGTGEDWGNSVTTDASGNVYMTGWFKSTTLSFGTTALANAGSGDIFLVKYNQNGSGLWAKSVGGMGSDLSFSVTTDNSGNVYMTGEFFSSTLIFGTTTLTNADVNFRDIFLVKYAPDGSELWAKSVGGTYDDGGRSVTTDASGNVYMIGYFGSSTLNFGATTLTKAGSYDIFLVKYAPDGSMHWAKSAGGTGTDEGKMVTTDASGNVYMTGDFSSPTLSFGTTTLTNAGSYDIFLVKLSDYNSIGIDFNININPSTQLYPNPTGECFMLSMSNMNTTKAVFTMYDIVGKNVVQWNEKINAHYRKDINMKDLPSGVYFLKIQTESKIEVVKVVRE